MSSADWWKMYGTPNMLDAPSRGQPNPQPAPAHAVPSESQLDTYKRAIEQAATQRLDDERPPLEEHARQVAEYAQGLAGRAPTDRETAAGIEQAQALRQWIDARWHGQLTGPEFFDELAERAYSVGLLSIWWALGGNPAELREFLQFMRDWQDRAGPASIEAMTKAERRESTEWHLLSLAIQKLEFDAATYDSPRLRQAAEHLRLMLAPDRVRPEAPAEHLRQKQAKDAITKRHSPTQEIRARIMAAFAKLPADRTLDDRAALLVDDALGWNREISPHPFTWEGGRGRTDAEKQRAAFKYIRRNVAKGRR